MIVERLPSPSADRRLRPVFIGAGCSPPALISVSSSRGPCSHAKAARRDVKAAAARKLAAVVVLLLGTIGPRTAPRSSIRPPLPCCRSTHHLLPPGRRTAGAGLARSRNTADAAAPLGVTPPRLVHAVLANQTELANGYATPLPRDTIVIYTVAPHGGEFDFDNWLQISSRTSSRTSSIDRSEGWARVARTLFGRAGRFRTCSFRSGRSKGSRPTKRA